MKRFFSNYLAAVLLLVALSFQATAQAPASTGLSSAINQELEKVFKPNEPGAAVIAVKDGQVVFRKGYGMANLELGVPIEPDMIFRIGSVTKQFTAVSILMLMEQGKLNLTDEITKFLPDYPTQGHKITIEHLLTHTSGIKSYTNLPEWLPLWRKDMTMKELIDLFKDKPMEFAPGDSWNYNNSAFVLLGAIIEKITGQSYGDFVEKNIFAPLGMKQSFYDNTQRVIPRRAAGYSKNGSGYANAQYLSMSQPHAAGSLMSTVDDLAKWDAALYTEKLVKQESLKKAWTPFVMNGGRPTNYGYGWGISTLQGEKVISHGGGINGFTCEAIRLPESKVYVAILTNRDSGTASLGPKIAALVAGKPISEPVAVKLPSLDKYVGVYQLNEKEEIVVTIENDSLFFQHPRAGKREILPISETEFFLKGQSSVRASFKQQGNAITALVIRSGFAPDEEAKRTNKPSSKAKETSAVDPANLDRLTGDYELMPNLILTITKEGGKLMGQATGQPKIELQPESATKFNIPQVGAAIEFVIEGDKTTSLILNQGGQKLTAKKIK
ncbi:MAG TPA: serine hydrolase [Blastocatellia bacterium]|nr:serine hydrolase [Blastocatellia bacterium]